MMRKVLLSLLLPFVAMASRAEQALVVHTADGQTAAFVLTGEPRITSTSDEVMVTANVDSVSYALSELDRFAIEDVELTGIASEQTPRSVFRVCEDGLCCEGLAPGERVLVYDLAGRLMRQAVADGSGRVSVPMTRGTCVIKAGNNTFKTIKR